MLGHEGPATDPPLTMELCGGDRCHMLSSLNTFGGLSAADILLLFNSNPSSSSSSTNATVANTAQSAQAGTVASANGTANAIQAILARAQIDHAQLETSLEDSRSIVTAQAAYAEQAESSGGEDTAVTGAAAASIASSSDPSSNVSDITFHSETAQTSVVQSNSTVETSMTSGPATMNEQVSAQSQISQSSTSVLSGVATADQEGDIQSLDYMSVTRVPIGPVITQAAYTEISSSSNIVETTYDGEIGVYENQNFINAGVSSSNVSVTDSSSFIQIGRSIADTSVGIGFSIDNLGPIINDDGAYSPANPQGTYGVQLQMNFDAAQGTSNEGESCTSGGEAMNIIGLTLSQAQAILDGFEQATGDDSMSDNSVGSAYLNTETVSGMNVNLSAVIANHAPQ
jgi:hypothetical protein